MVVAFLLLLSFACSPFSFEGFAYYKKLPANYAVLAVDTRELTEIIQGIGGSSVRSVIGPMIFAYGWNEDFIIAKQHPNLDFLKGLQMEITNWFIIEVKTQRIYGPLTEEKYIETRQKLGVPYELIFTDTIEP